MGTLRGIKQSNIRITRLNQGVGTSFLIGMDDADIAAIARVTTDGGENTKQFIANLTPGREMPQIVYECLLHGAV